MTAPAHLVCADCGAPMQALKGPWGPFYGCTRYPACKGRHSAHADGSPMGTPGNAETRAARRAAHAAVDPLWKLGMMHRRAVYQWLARLFDRKDVHIGALNVADCQRVVDAATAWRAKRERELELQRAAAPSLPNPSRKNTP